MRALERAFVSQSWAKGPLGRPRQDLHDPDGVGMALDALLPAALDPRLRLDQ
jgi:hypothetical protein